MISIWKLISIFALVYEGKELEINIYTYIGMFKK